MKQGLGTTTFGAILLAGFIFQSRNVSGPSSGQSDSNAVKSALQAAIKPVTGDGPWLASCKYWSAAQLAKPANDEASPGSDITLHQTGNSVKLHVETATSPDAACGPGQDGWGIPSSTPGPPDNSHNPEISALIATVPDPIHSDLALDFDRSVDAILLAASDNGYLASYYWLPWQGQATSLDKSESVDSAPNEKDNTRERQPGLIILRYSPDAAKWEKTSGQEFSAASYHRLIYLFLVGETPALGVNGAQLQSAFHYEKILKDNHHATLYVRPWSFGQKNAPRQQTASICSKQHDATDQLSVIGPIFSGSAASLHEGIEVAKRTLCPSKISITGVTGTAVAFRELDPQVEHIYRSFGENSSFEQQRFLQSLDNTGYDLSRVAVLSEAGTVFGGGARYDVSKKYDEVGARPIDDEDLTKKGTILSLKFPRELSLLRNAQSGQHLDASAPPSPYLNLSLKGSAGDDTVPRFSSGQSPLSIEAQLMAIAHQLQRAQTQFILFSASNILDDIYLAQFLHRACPDASLVVLNGGDLLFERDGENASNIGSISISPYLLTSLDFGNKVQWLHSDNRAQAIYNAASYTFWDRTVDRAPQLAGYRPYPVPENDSGSEATGASTQFLQVPLWAAVIGADGYYPLGVLHWCGSNVEAILPTIQLDNPAHLTTPRCDEQQTASVVQTDSGEPGSAKPRAVSAEQHVWKYVPESINQNSGVSPSLLWMVLDTIILLVCVLHTALLWAAQFWSPTTRDLAVEQNDQPHRRSVHLNIGTAVLVAMAFVTAYPFILVGQYYHLSSPAHLLAWLTIVAGLLALVSTLIKTWPYRFHECAKEYCFFNLVAAVFLVFTVTFWIAICRSDNLDGTSHSYAGLYFSYRCLQPQSGVCPLLPILFLLLAWYFWSMCQTARLRFSHIQRPRIARLPTDSTYLPGDSPYPLFVSDDVLEGCARPIDSCLYTNMTCLLITREVICRFCTDLKSDSRRAVRSLAARVGAHLNQALGAVYLSLFALCLFASHIHSLDRFLFSPMLAPVFRSLSTGFGVRYGPTLYEFLVTALFFPLIMVALSGWLRIILIWGALSRGLLDPLERLPIRFAFKGFKGGSWVNMLNQSGLQFRWREMSRSTESIRQLVHHRSVRSNPALKAELSKEYKTINVEIRKLIDHSRAAGGRPPDGLSASAPTLYAPQSNAQEVLPTCTNTPSSDLCKNLVWDRPKSPGDVDLCIMYSIEQGYARFCGALLNSLLIPYWDQERTGLVEESKYSNNDEAKTGRAAKDEPPEKLKPGKPGFISLAEELIVLRYVALIRAVLVNMRYLMLFVLSAFVLSIVAWNSYPFQPHRLVDWCFTLLLILIGTGFVWVFAQMHRNPLLGRITDTSSDKLGIDFYIRIVTFGAVPVLTWLAYQFPEVGGSLFRIFQPSLQVMK